MPPRSRPHLVRCLALVRAQRLGWLDGRYESDIAACLGVHQTTISRDLQDLADVDTEANLLLEKLRPEIQLKAPE
jgi:hypothetical protein